MEYKGIERNCFLPSAYLPYHELILISPPTLPLKLARVKNFRKFGHVS